jgi:molybdate transport system substrate-binding protein
MKRVFLLALLLAGCGGGDDALVVSAASSLKGAFTEYGGARFSFAGSDELAAQIRQGLKPDVFASANTALPRRLFEEGLVEQPRVFARNRLVVAVPDAGRVRTLDDLYDPGVKLAVGSPEVPVGAYTRRVIAKLDRPRQILGAIRTNEPDVKGVVGKLTQGAVDAGFVYVTDVQATPGVRAIELPARVMPQVEYGVAVVKGADHPEAARRFVDGLFDGAGRDALARAGFGVPRG